MHNEVNKSFDTQHLVQGGWPSHDIEDDAQYDADVSFDGYSSSTQGSVLDESTHETTCEGLRVPEG
jgi:hypothetical protein